MICTNIRSGNCVILMVGYVLPVLYPVNQDDDLAVRFHPFKLHHIVHAPIDRVHPAELHNTVNLDRKSVV